MIYIVLWDILKSHEIRHRINLTVVAHCVGLIQCQIVHVGYGGCVETRSTTMSEARQIHNSCIYIYIYIYMKNSTTIPKDTTLITTRPCDELWLVEG